jgi:hypothetical protein
MAVGGHTCAVWLWRGFTMFGTSEFGGKKGLGSVFEITK